MALKVRAGSGEVIGEIDSLRDLDKIPTWENALQRTTKAIVINNDGYITDERGKIVWDSEDQD